MEFGQRQRFLVVDDEPVAIRAIATTLRRRGDVTGARSVAEARQALAKQPSWDALFADCRLPDGSGLDLVADFRRLFPDVPVLVLSGHVEGEMVNAAFDLGAEIMAKPCQAVRIREFLDGCPRHSRRSTPPSGPASADDTGESLDETIARLRRLLERPSESLTRYAVGCTIKRLKKQPHGARAVQMAAEALAEDLASLYRYAKVAECWTAVEVEQLLMRRQRDGFQLSWSHLVLLATLECAAVRALYLERSFDEELSVRGLTSLLTAAHLVGSARSSGT